MRFLIFGYFSFIILMFVLSSCKEDQVITKHTFGEEFIIQNNSEIIIFNNKNDISSVDQLKLKVISIEDSRCPEDATCIWYGYAKVNFTIEDQENVYSLCLGDCINIFNQKDEIIVNTPRGDYLIKLIAVNPFPKLGEENHEKSATFLVRKK